MIILTRYSLPVFKPGPNGAYQHSYPIKITSAIDSGDPGLPAEIFVYHAYPASPTTPATNVFENVASAVDMGIIPANAPLIGIDNERITPYFRAATLLFHCLSPEEADEFWLKVQSDVQDLVTNWKAAQTLSQVATVTIV